VTILLERYKAFTPVLILVEFTTFEFATCSLARVC